MTASIGVRVPTISPMAFIGWKAKSFHMLHNLTQYTEHSPLFGEKVSKGLPIVFNGAIGNGLIDGEARVVGRNKHAHRFRLSKVPARN